MILNLGGFIFGLRPLFFIGAFPFCLLVVFMVLVFVYPVFALADWASACLGLMWPNRFDCNGFGLALFNGIIQNKCHKGLCTCI